MDKKTILIATDCFMPRIDGIARFLEMIIPHLKEYKVIVVAPDYRGSFNHDDSYQIFRVPLRSIRIGDFVPAKTPNKKILGIIDQADIIFSQTIGPIGSAIIKKAYKKNKRIISFVHSIEWILVEKSLSKYNLARSIASLIAQHHARKIYNMCDSIIVPSNNIGEIFSARGIRKPKYVVHLGIDTEYFKPSNKNEAKNILGYKEDDFIIGYVGRIAREKSLITLKKAFMNLNGANNRLLLVGEGLKSLERSLGHPKTKITGKTEDVVKYLNAMDVFVMPSLTETTCLAALEAMSCELPIVTTKVGNIKEYVKDKVNGLFFPKENHHHLAIKLNYLKDNPDKRRELGVEARKTVVKEYDYKSTIKNILKVIELNIK